MQAGSVISHSPSFNTYSDSKLSRIAGRVVGEFDSDEFSDEFCFERRETSDAGEEEEEFEFASTGNFESSSPMSADEIFHGGKIRPVYPVFNRDSLLVHAKFRKEINHKLENGAPNSVPSKEAPKIRAPLRKLFMEERKTTMTMSSEAEVLDGVPAETYCVWRPKSAEGQHEKSSSAGFDSKRWKLKDLLHRSHTDGSKGSFVFKENEKKIRV